MARPKSLVTVADSGDTLETLKVLRHKLAQTIQKSESGRDIAALSKQLREVMREIETAAPEEVMTNVTVLDLIRNKHAKEA